MRTVASAEHGRASVDRQAELAINRYAIALDPCHRTTDRKRTRESAPSRRCQTIDGNSDRYSDSPNLVRRPVESGHYTSIDYPRRSPTTACWPGSGRSETPTTTRWPRTSWTAWTADRRPDLAYAIAARARRRGVPRPINHSRLHESLGDLPPAEFEPKRRGLRPPRGERRTGHRRPASALPVPSEILMS